MSISQILSEPAPEDSLAFYPEYPIASQRALKQAITFLQRITVRTKAHNNFALYGSGLFELATSQRATLEVAIPCDLPIAAIQEQRRHSNITVYGENDVSLTAGGLTLHLRTVDNYNNLINQQTPEEAQAIITMTPNGPVVAASLDFIKKASAATKADYKASLTPHEARRKGPALCSVKAMPY